MNSTSWVGIRQLALRMGLAAVLCMSFSSQSLSARRAGEIAKSSEIALPHIIRGVFVPMALLEEDGSLTAPLVAHLQDFSMNVLIVEMPETDETLSTTAQNMIRDGKHEGFPGTMVWAGVRNAQLLETTGSRSTKRLFVKALPDTDFATTQSKDVSDISTSISEALAVAKGAGVVGLAAPLPNWASAESAKPANLKLLSLDLVSLRPEDDDTTESTARRLRDLAEENKELRIAPWVDVRAANNPTELEEAVRGCIEIVGGAVVMLPPEPPPWEIWEAIRRGLEANFLLPEG